MKPSYGAAFQAASNLNRHDKDGVAFIDLEKERIPMMHDNSKHYEIDGLRLTIPDWVPTHHARVYFHPVEVKVEFFEIPMLLRDKNGYWRALERVYAAINREVFGADFSQKGFEVPAVWQANQYAPHGDFEGHMLLRAPSWQSAEQFDAVVRRAWAEEESISKLTWVQPWDEAEFETRLVIVDVY